MGKVKKHHFAHKNVVDCNQETYLHKLSKELFYNKYEDCKKNNIPFYLKYRVNLECDFHIDVLGTTCKLQPEYRIFNLINRFSGIKMEKKDGTFIPDIMIYDRWGIPIYIEMSVSHDCENKKIESGNRIIEFRIENEDDFSLFLGDTIDLQNEKVTSYNFVVNTDKKTIIQDCAYKFLCFFGYSTFKTNLVSIPLQKYCLEIQNSNVVYYKIIHEEFGCSSGWREACLYKRQVIELYEKDNRFKNCFLCRYHASSNLEGLPIFCKFLKQRFKSTHAPECPYFRADKRVYEEYLLEENEMEENGMIENEWENF